jgi:hypothetical protein
MEFIDTLFNITDYSSAIAEMQIPMCWPTLVDVGNVRPRPTEITAAIASHVLCAEKHKQ